MPLPMKAENSNVCSAWEILAGAEASGVCAVLGGGLVGTETALVKEPQTLQQQSAADIMQQTKFRGKNISFYEKM